jgi:hypothetical protein
MVGLTFQIVNQCRFVNSNAGACTQAETTEKFTIRVALMIRKFQVTNGIDWNNSDMM